MIAWLQVFRLLFLISAIIVGFCRWKAPRYNEEPFWQAQVILLLLSILASYLVDIIG